MKVRMKRKLLFPDGRLPPQWILEIEASEQRLEAAAAQLEAAEHNYQVAMDDARRHRAAITALTT